MKSRQRWAFATSLTMVRELLVEFAALFYPAVSLGSLTVFGGLNNLIYFGQHAGKTYNTFAVSFLFGRQ